MMWHWAFVLVIAGLPVDPIVSDDGTLGISAESDARIDDEASTDIVTMLPGVVQPRQLITLSAPFDGTLMDVLVEEGQRVREGQELVVMDNRIAMAEVQLAMAVNSRKANMERARHELKLAENVLGRLLSVPDQQAVSALEVDRARNARDQAESLLTQALEEHREAQLRLQLARARLESHTIRAPFDGKALRIRGRVGQAVTNADELLTLANLKTLRTELHVPIRWFGKLQVGASYTLVASSPVDRRIKATLVSFDPMLDAATQTFRCVFEIDNSSQRFPAGFTARLMHPVDTDASTDLAFAPNSEGQSNN